MYDTATTQQREVAKTIISMVETSQKIDPKKQRKLQHSR
jgi:hypothetical protein